MKKSNKVISIDEEDKFIEVELEDKKILELIKKLKDLTVNKKHVHFELNNGELLVHHSGDTLK